MSSEGDPRKLFPGLMAGTWVSMAPNGEAANDADTAIIVSSTNKFLLEVSFKSRTRSGFYLDAFTTREADVDFALLKVVVRYGHTFILSELHLFTKSVYDALQLSNELEAWRKFALASTYNRSLDMFLGAQFSAMVSKSGIVKVDPLHSFLKSVCRRVSLDHIRGYVSANKRGLDLAEFVAFYRSVINAQAQQSDAVNTVFSKSFDPEDRRLGCMSARSLKRFLCGYQGVSADSIDEKELNKTMRKYISGSAPNGSYFDLGNFLDYLLSVDNDVCDASKLSLRPEAMTQPLSSYFISSSHNTYLTGNQLASEASAEAYSRVLRMGVRCVELDCFDGADGKPVVTHGMTMCSKIRLADALKAIKESAFATSPYPVLLSIEDHCSAQQQIVMAQMFEEAFDTQLVRHPAPGDWASTPGLLPSPEQLKHKIIVKHKARKANKSSEDESLVPQFFGSAWVRLDCESTWHNASIALACSLIEVELDTSKALGAGAQPYVNFVARDNDEDETQARWSALAEPEVEICNATRAEAESLLKLLQPTLKPGTFMLRTSSVGNIAMSLLAANVIHISIGTSHLGYSVLKDEHFRSLDALVERYRQGPLSIGPGSGGSERVTLTDRIDSRHLYRIKEWYFPKLKEETINRILSDCGCDGTFLVRDSPCSESGTASSSASSSEVTASLILSFVWQGQVLHVRLEQTSFRCKIGGEDSSFWSACDVVDHFRYHPLYRGCKLTAAYRGATDCLGEKLKTEGHSSSVKSRYLSGSELMLDDFVSGLAGSHDSERRPSEAGIKIIKMDLAGSEVSSVSEPSPLDPSETLACVRVANVANAQPILFASPCKDFLWKELALRLHEASERSAVFYQERERATIAKEGLHGIGSYPLTARNTECAGPPPQAVRTLEPPSPAGPQCKLPKELTDVMVYCKAVSFDAATLNKVLTFAGDEEPCDEMNSFSEVKAKQIMIDGAQWKAFQKWHRRRLTRGLRTDSSNYDPIPYWLCGAQMVALNFQTASRELQLERGWFLRNGGCGYVPKPDFMVSGCFDPSKAAAREDSVDLTVSVLCGRHLARKVKTSAAVDVFVKLEVVGCSVDCAVATTEVVQGNALNPRWDECFPFGQILVPSLAVLRISVHSTQQQVLGQVCLPVEALRTGFRSVRLRNGFNEHDSGLSVLLVHISRLPRANSSETYLKKIVENYMERTKRKESSSDAPAVDDEEMEEAMAALTRVLSRHTLPSITVSVDGDSATSEVRKVYGEPFKVGVVDAVKAMAERKKE